jgi:hypothetical protein
VTAGRAGAWWLLAAVALGAGCREGDEARTPAGAVRVFARGADPRPGARDRDRVYALVGPRTRQRLTEAARLASQQAGARKALDWKEMLLVGLARPRYELADARVLEQGPTTARVEVRGTGGEREVVELTREGELWKLELPEPAPEPTSAPASAAAPASAPAPAAAR